MVRVDGGDNCFELVKFLVKSGINVNAEKSRALFFALKNGKLDIAEYLLQHGAKPLESILQDCVRWGNVKEAEILLRYPITISGFLIADTLVDKAVCSNNPEMVHFIMQWGNIYLSREQRNGHFKWAVNNGQFEIAKILRDFGARIE